MNAVRNMIVAATALLLLASASAGPTVIKRHHNVGGQDIELAAVVIPAGSPVRFKGTDKKYIEGVEFEGRFLLSGKYHFGWDRSLGQWRASIIPDKDVAARLPSFAEVGGAQEIFLSNPRAFAKGVLSKAEFARAGKKRAQASGRTQVWADRLYAFVQCGYPWYSARFIEVAKPKPVAVAKAWEWDAC